ncbi:hypothetical protein HDK90DRAFT_234790 [Phyllosticta capitalensis]|uniref:Secreted protein n=1 Tax=Phyllosticta capitalensis TaxID=121624 RepID=A0ABR1YNU1_9PEZI
MRRCVLISMEFNFASFLLATLLRDAGARQFAPADRPTKYMLDTKRIYSEDWKQAWKALCGAASSPSRRRFECSRASIRRLLAAHLPLVTKRWMICPCSGSDTQLPLSDAAPIASPYYLSTSKRPSRLEMLAKIQIQG